jgi:Pyruvate-formate lyase-activating enzyme
MTVSEVIDEVMVDSLFYNVSGGGMTVSGGEPMFQPEFTLELLKAAKNRGLHTCMETCGFCARSLLINAVPCTDLFLFDLKATADVHEYWTGVPLEPILRSLYALDSAGGKIILRCPLIPGVNINDGHMESIAGISDSLKNIIEINLEPYHPVGISKCEAIGGKPGYEESKMLQRGEAEKWAEKLRERTKVPVTVV